MPITENSKSDQIERVAVRTWGGDGSGDGVEERLKRKETKKLRGGWDYEEKKEGGKHFKKIKRLYEKSLTHASSSSL